MPLSSSEIQEVDAQNIKLLLDFQIQTDHLIPASSITASIK